MNQSNDFNASQHDQMEAVCNFAAVMVQMMGFSVSGVQVVDRGRVEVSFFDQGDCEEFSSKVEQRPEMFMHPDFEDMSVSFVPVFNPF